MIRISNLFRAFVADRGGQFAILMSLLSIPLLAAVGLSVDYSYAVQVRSRLRAANDAAALYAALEFKKHGELPGQPAMAAYLESNFNAPSGDPVPTIKAATLDGLVFTLDSEVKAPVFIMQVFGNANTDVTATSSVTIGQDTLLDISLALDTTHSMTKPAGVSPSEIDPDGTLLPPGITEVKRIDALKVAALRFNDAILNDDNLKERSRISIVPFARYINVGLANRNAPWLSVPDDSGPTGETCWDHYEVTGYGTCEPYTWYYDGVPVVGSHCPPIYGSTSTRMCSPTGEKVWSGCVGSRPEPNNLAESYAGSKFPGLLNTWCNTDILPLTNDAIKVANHISSLWTNDYTYIPEGVMWGWRVLTKAMPYQEGVDPAHDKKVRKIMVLMTDGENQAMADLPDAPTHHVLSPDMDPAQYASEVAKANMWTRTACERAKEDKVELFVISFGTDIGGDAKYMLEQCASDSSHYYDATNAKKLIEAFEAIAYRVGATYLSN